MFLLVSLVLALGTEKSLSPSFFLPSGVFLSLLFSRLKGSRSQTFLTGELIQPRLHFFVTLLDSFLHVRVSLVLSPGLDTTGVALPELSGKE